MDGVRYDDPPKTPYKHRAKSAERWTAISRPGSTPRAGLPCSLRAQSTGSCSKVRTVKLQLVPVTLTVISRSWSSV